VLVTSRASNGLLGRILGQRQSLLRHWRRSERSLRRLSGRITAAHFDKAERAKGDRSESEKEAGSDTNEEREDREKQERRLVEATMQET
jgi:hypothetical protein